MGDGAPAVRPERGQHVLIQATGADERDAIDAVREVLKLSAPRKRIQGSNGNAKFSRVVNGQVAKGLGSLPTRTMPGTPDSPLPCGAIAPPRAARPHDRQARPIVEGVAPPLDRRVPFAPGHRMDTEIRRRELQRANSRDSGPRVCRENATSAIGSSRRNFHGKEGVIGSSPIEGLA
jgi:hypothetical protein